MFSRLHCRELFSTFLILSLGSPFTWNWSQTVWGGCPPNHLRRACVFEWSVLRGVTSKRKTPNDLWVGPPRFSFPLFCQDSLTSSAWNLEPRGLQRLMRSSCASCSPSTALPRGPSFFHAAGPFEVFLSLIHAFATQNPRTSKLWKVGPLD